MTEAEQAVAAQVGAVEAFIGDYAIIVEMADGWRHGVIPPPDADIDAAIAQLKVWASKPR